MDAKEIDGYVREAARRAVPLLEAGWTQGSLYAEAPDGGTAYCMLGALMVGMQELMPSDRDLVQNEFSRRIHSLTGAHGAVAYNDYPGRKKVEVVELMQMIAGEEPA